MKKRYLLFVYPEYYPCGGFDDLVDDFDTLEDVKNALIERHSDAFNVYDQDERLLLDLPDCWWEQKHK